MWRSKQAMWATVVLLAVAVAGGGWAASQRVLDGRTPASNRAASQSDAGQQASEKYNSSSATLGWPNLFGPSFNSISTEQGINPVWPETGPRVVWRASVGEGYSSPVAEGNDVVVFHRPIKAAGEPAPDDLHAGEANHGPDEVLTCWDAETGAERWEFRQVTSYRCQTHYSSGPYSTPILARDHVYACGTEGNLYCLHRAGGTPVWQRALWKDFGRQQEGYFPVTGSPLLVGDRLILNLGARDAGAGIVAIDAATGETLWQATDHEASYATPCAATIHGQEFVFVFTAQGLVSLDPQSGQVHWTVKFRANNPEMVNATTPIVVGDIVFTSGHALGNLCLRILPDGSYKELWRDKRRNFDSQYNPLTCIDGCVYGFAALDDTFRCIDLLSGEVRWKGLREIERGAMIAADGHFLILGTEGHLASARISATRLEVVSCIAGGFTCETSGNWSLSTCGNSRTGRKRRGSAIFAKPWGRTRPISGLAIDHRALLRPQCAIATPPAASNVWKDSLARKDP
jgi:outer membrane protein assembly factor BamB